MIFFTQKLKMLLDWTPLHMGYVPNYAILFLFQKVPFEIDLI